MSLSEETNRKKKSLFANQVEIKWSNAWVSSLQPTSLLPLRLLAPQVSPGFYSFCLHCLVWVHFVFILVPDVLSQQILPSPWMCHFSFFWEELRSLLGAAAGPEPSFRLGSAEPCSSRAWNGCQCTLLTLWEFGNISLIKIVVVFVLPGSPFHLHHSDFASSLQEASVGGNSEW